MIENPHVSDHNNNEHKAKVDSSNIRTSMICDFHMPSIGRNSFLLLVVRVQKCESGSKMKRITISIHHYSRTRTVLSDNLDMLTSKMYLGDYSYYICFFVVIPTNSSLDSMTGKIQSHDFVESHFFIDDLHYCLRNREQKL